MVGKRSGKALLREEGLERTDNNMDLTTWPQVPMINQKNYYTEYLRRDDQILSLRDEEDEPQDRAKIEAKDKGAGNDVDNDVDNDVTMDVDEEEEGGDQKKAKSGTKVIIVHPGSQNLRIGLASEPLPKTVPMVIARKAKQNESEEQGEPSPKRLKLEDGSFMEPEKMFGPEFATTYNKMSQELKVGMRANKRRVLPNSKEMVVNFNSRMQPEIISKHNDPLQIEWTEVPRNPKEAPEYFTGMEALRIPDDSVPRYKLFWPIQNGWYNEAAYSSKSALLEDISAIIENAVKKDLNIPKKRDWAQYSCLLVIPDLYERNYVTQMLEMLIRDFAFGQVCFVQESLAATYGAGFTTSCVVDIGAQKTSICCVEEGLCVENSRVNLKMGGADVTDTFIRMMLYDHFPYEEIDLKRRYDLLLANEIKEKHLTMNETDISTQLYDFHVRAPGQDTRKYEFKTYDEVILPVSGLFAPHVFDHSGKLNGRHKLVGASIDLYDGSPNDPTSAAQSEIINTIAPAASPPITNGETNGTPVAAPIPTRPGQNPIARLQDTETASARGSPAPEGERDGTPAPGDDVKADAPQAKELAACLRDDVLPVLALDSAILMSITHGAKGDERRVRDFLLGIMVIGGGAQVQGFLTVLEERLKVLSPRYAKDITVGPPPRELDPQGVIWKGGSVAAKIKANDTWISKLEFDRLGARCLAYKTLWAW